MLLAQPEHAGALGLLSQATPLLEDEGSNDIWPWPETRLSYANAVLPEASLAAATLRKDSHRASRALDRLGWLVERQTLDGHFSFTPVGGSDVASSPPLFDQQPIEAWAMASAGARAFATTRDKYWADVVQRAAAWFLGDKDIGVALFDPVTGGGYDGPEPNGVNRNEGAESSMAFVATMLHVCELTSN